MDMDWDGWEAGVVSIQTYALDPNGTSWSWRVSDPSGSVFYDAAQHGGWWRSPDAARGDARGAARHLFPGDNWDFQEGTEEPLNTLL